MKSILQKVAIPIIILGTFLTAIVFFTGTLENVTVIMKETRQIGSYTWSYYTFDFRQYLVNLEEAITAKVFLSNIDLSFPMLPVVPNWADIPSILKYIANSFIFVPNFFMYLLNNIILLPIKLILYPINILLTLLGLNTYWINNGYVKAINDVLSFTLRYINYL